MHILSNTGKIKTMKTKNIVKALYRESTSFLYRIGGKIKDKFIWTHTEMEEAIGFLIYFRNYLKNNKASNLVFKEIFGESGEFFEVKHFKKGFNSKLITFKTFVGEDIKKWVLKIGYKLSLVVDFGDPSTEDYYKERKKHLDILKKELKKYKELNNLLPKPEEIIWAKLQEEGITTERTLVLQPFLHVVKPSRVKKKLNDDQRKILIKEFNAFKKLCNTLLKDYELEPDLLGEGNLEIIRNNDEYHLMLLDSGFVNMQKALPITQTLMHFALTQTLTNTEKLIKKVL